MQTTEATGPILAWEASRGLKGFIKALFSIVGKILFRPVDFFRGLLATQDVDSRRRIIRAVQFAVTLGYIKLLFDLLNVFWLRIFVKDTFSLSTAILGSPFFFLRPIVVFVVTLALVTAGIKLVLGFDKSSMPALLVVCYKSAADIFYCLPVFGGILATLWSAALIAIGVRQLYCAGIFRSVISSVVVPFMFFFLIILSLGPFLNKVVAAFYPETQSQLVKVNEITAYLYTTATISAIKKYKQELGFYPFNLGGLKKYLSTSVAAEITNVRPINGYKYYYSRPDEGHFTLKVIPFEDNHFGRVGFYADETGEVRLGGPQGEVIKDLTHMEEAASKAFLEK